MRPAGASGEDIERYRKDEFTRAERKMQEEIQALPAGSAIGKLLVHGYPAPVLIREAERLGADLIVIGKHGGTTLDERLPGSVTQNVLYQAGCNVLLAP